MNIVISAIICTHNRAKYLRKAIQSLRDQTLDPKQYEIIIVDNGSTDNTKHIVLDEFAGVTNLSYVYEPVLGLSQARNTGWKNARGKYVAYLDDDAIADSQWIEKILLTFNSVQPTPGALGGKVEPIWEAPRPGWVPDSMLVAFTIVDWSKSPTVLNEKQCLPGANVAFPKDVIKEAGGFQVELGRKGNKLLSMEEVLLRRKLEAKGYRCYYHPEIVVWHHIPALRITRSWFIRRWYWQGVSEAVLQIHQESPSPLERIRRVVPIVKSLLLFPRRFAKLAVPTSDPNNFKSKCLDFSRVGYIMGMIGLAK